MASAVNAIIHSQGMRDRIPKEGEMVRVEGRKGLFLVTQVEQNQQTAEVIQRTWKRETVALTVPLNQIHVVSPQASNAIQQFLGAGQLHSRKGPTIHPISNPSTSV